jgi:hypothetical protein
MTNKLLPLLVLLLPLAIVAPSWAVTTSHWTQSNESDFKAGRAHDVVTTSLGHLKLSRAVTTLLAEEPKVGAVYALAEAPDGTVYAGTGPQGVLLRIKGEKVETALELGDGVNISSLLVDADGGLLVGVGGAKGIVYRIAHPDAAKPEPLPIFEADGVQYVWAMSRAADDTVYLATGPTGTLFELKPDGSHAVLLKTDENNLTCLASDGKDLLYVGSDTNGLVYRVDRRTRASFVLYNAAETEIGALAVDAKGDLYVGTSQASDQPPAAADDTAAKDKVGHPEGAAGGAPIQSDPPKQPAPPPSPTPNPGQPDPIPKRAGTQPTEGMAEELPGDEPDPGQDPGGGGLPTPAPKPPAGPGAAAPKGAGPQPAQQATNTAGTGQPASTGNAVYRIDPAGFVTEVFRGPVLVMSMAATQDGAILVATGSDGLVYQINPAADETAVVARLDAKQVTALLPTRDGRVLLGLSNTGGLAAMGSGYAERGTYTSQAFDAQQTSRFGHVQLHGTLPGGTGLTLSTRSGNTKEPTDAGWSPWSPEEPAAEFVATRSPAARFFQYRLTFTSKQPSATPTVDDVDVAYLSPNLAPVIKAVRVTVGPKPSGGDPQQAEQPPAPPATPPQPTHVLTVAWDASDPNNDPLVFAVYERPGRVGPWVLIKDKLKDPNFEWDTRGVADGRYELKVTASDVAANPVGQGKVTARVSDPVLVDNTPPVIGAVKSGVDGSSVTVTLRAVDAVGTVAAVDYAVDSTGDWQAATPSDTMFDSPTAAATLTATGLTPGPHTIAVRVTDERGNQAFQNVTATVEAAAAK